MDLSNLNPMVVAVGCALVGLFVGWLFGLIKSRKYERRYYELENEAYAPLRSSYDSLQRDHVYLDEENDRLKQALEDATGRINNFEEEVKEAQTKATSEADQWKEKAKELNLQIDTGKKEYLNSKERWENHANGLENQIKEKNEKINELNAKVEEMLKEANHLKAQEQSNLGNASQWEQKYAALEKEYTALKESGIPASVETESKYNNLLVEYSKYKQDTQLQLTDWKTKYGALNNEYAKYRELVDKNRKDLEAKYQNLQQKLGGTQNEPMATKNDWENKFNRLNIEYADYKNNHLVGTGTEVSNGLTSEWEKRFNQLHAKFEEYKKETERKLSEKPKEIVKEIEIVRAPNSLEELQQMMSKISSVEVSRKVAGEAGNNSGSLS